MGFNVVCNTSQYDKTYGSRIICSAPCCYSSWMVKRVLPGSPLRLCVWRRRQDERTDTGQSTLWSCTGLYFATGHLRFDTCTSVILPPLLCSHSLSTSCLSEQ